MNEIIYNQPVQASALPNGPKISSGGCLSPRGDWRAPSDGNARVYRRAARKCAVMNGSGGQVGAPIRIFTNNACCETCWSCYLAILKAETVSDRTRIRLRQIPD